MYNKIMLGFLMLKGGSEIQLDHIAGRFGEFN